MSKKTVKDIDLKGKKVFVRCDFNVPMDENKNITDNRRIVAALPTIKYLLEQNCKVILSSHLGRPKGEFKKEFSLAPIAAELSKLLGKEVKLAKDVIGEDAQALVDITATIETSKGTIVHPFTSVPVRENYRTNIVGNLISSTTDFEITIEDSWSGYYDIPEGEYDTLSGYLIEELGRIPDDDENPVIETERVTYKIEEYEDKRIKLVKACKNNTVEEQEDEEENEE